MATCVCGGVLSVILYFGFQSVEVQGLNEPVWKRSAYNFPDGTPRRWSTAPPWLRPLYPTTPYRWSNVNPLKLTTPSWKSDFNIPKDLPSIPDFKTGSSFDSGSNYNSHSDRNGELSIGLPVAGAVAFLVVFTCLFICCVRARQRARLSANQPQPQPSPQPQPQPTSPRLPEVSPRLPEVSPRLPEVGSIVVLRRFLCIRVRVDQDEEAGSNVPYRRMEPTEPVNPPTYEETVSSPAANNAPPSYTATPPSNNGPPTLADPPSFPVPPSLIDLPPPYAQHL